MSFRVEKKILFQKNNIHEFNNWKKRNNVKEIYETEIHKKAMEYHQTKVAKSMEYDDSMMVTVISIDQLIGIIFKLFFCFFVLISEKFVGLRKKLLLLII